MWTWINGLVHGLNIMHGYDNDYYSSPCPLHWLGQNISCRRSQLFPCHPSWLHPQLRHIHHRALLFILSESVTESQSLLERPPLRYDFSILVSVMLNQSTTSNQNSITPEYPERDTIGKAKTPVIITSYLVYLKCTILWVHITDRHRHSRER